MSDMDELEFGSDQKKPPRKVVVEDKRFNREEIMHGETVSENAAPSEAETPSEGGKESADKPPVSETEGAERHQAATEVPPSTEPSAEEAESRREITSLFELGIDGFLKQNLGIILNFAYIYMGLVANPASGLVTQDLGKAKLAIDTFEFVVGKLKDEFKPQEEAELSRVLKDLKLNFMNAASAPAPKPPPSKQPG